MRSRPKVEVLLAPSVVLPGTRLATETVLTSTSETPFDFVEIELSEQLDLAEGQGKGRTHMQVVPFHHRWRSESGTLAPGTHRFPVTFDVPADARPSYRGEDASAKWLVKVLVAIPWWPDRVATYEVPVVLPPSADLPPKPIAVATSREGPTGTDPFLELAIDTNRVALGDTLTGTVSLANFRGKRVTGVSGVFTEYEDVDLPVKHVATARQFSFRIFDGQPRENEPIPFKVGVPERAAPTHASPPFGVRTRLEITAHVAWGSDVRVAVALFVAPRGTRQIRGDFVAPVGRERRAKVWEAAAAHLGFLGDPTTERMRGTRGVVAIAIHTEHRDGDYWLACDLSWPSLGLELEVGERRWSDMFAMIKLETGDAVVDGRFAVYGREAAQTAAVATGALLRTLLPFDDVKLLDGGATVAMRGSAHTTEKVEAFLQAVLVAAEAISAAHGRVPPPAAFRDAVPAWQALAERLRGRLELGRMWIHDGQIGQDRVAVGTLWASSSPERLATQITVAIDPPLASVPASADDPSISPSAREAWQALAEGAQVSVHADRVVARWEGKSLDPRDRMPLVELAVSLRRRLAGAVAQGPFR